MLLAQSLDTLKILFEKARACKMLFNLREEKEKYKRKFP